MSVHLKIKSKHLAAEAKIIKREEAKLKRAAHRYEVGDSRRQSRLDVVNDLASHRKDLVRSAARSTHLARGFLRGMRYRRIEDERTRTEPNWPEVEGWS